MLNDFSPLYKGLGDNCFLQETEERNIFLSPSLSPPYPSLSFTLTLFFKIRLYQVLHHLNFLSIYSSCAFGMS